MITKPPGPRYIRRAEERDIHAVLAQVRADGASRAVLLQGPGGIGKTSIVRHMAAVSGEAVIDWVRPVDADDPEVWLLSNLERRIVRQIDPAGRHFGPYIQQLSRLDSYPAWGPSHEAVTAYLGRIKKVFATCYLDYVDSQQKTVVIAFDTVETIRGTTLLLTLTQWMKELRRGTLFVLSGRPAGGEAADPIMAELSTQYHGISVTQVPVHALDLEGTREFLGSSHVSRGLRGDEPSKLVLLSRGHPLWLAVIEDYLAERGVPEEAASTALTFLEENLPFGAEPTEAGREIHERFLHRLLSPYRDQDFWHEAIKRLAIVRQPVARAVWERLMADMELPGQLHDLEEAWTWLLSLPWMRPRGDRRYVTVHDALAEALSERLFPLHDQDQRWRHRVWGKARDIYDTLAVTLEPQLDSDAERLDDEIETLNRRAGEIRQDVIDSTSELNTRKHELALYLAAGVYYQFLTDFAQGCAELLSRYEHAEQVNDTYFQDLIVLYLQRFLPGGTPAGAFNDVVRLKLEEFRRWLAERPDHFIELALLVARHLIETSQASAALRLLRNLPEPPDQLRRHRITLLSGNACLRIPGEVWAGRRFFERALAQARELKTPDSAKLTAEAHKELGYYYRNTGEWWKADESYARARDALSTGQPARKPDSEREEIASIQTNWAYVKGLNGGHLDASELAESAISIRHTLKNPAAEALSWSVRGEVYRYARRFEMAWAAYGRAERLLGSRHVSRLGFVRQQQAICLHQASQDGISLTADPQGDAVALITLALGICQIYSIRAYPSALNRAGRIFAEKDPDLALEYLREGIAEAKKLSDGWFWFANLVEYAELSYSRLQATGNAEYRRGILALSDEIVQVSGDYTFPDLVGRWRLIMGHLEVAAGGPANLASALEHYQAGFASIAERNVGSSGAAAIPAQFATFKQVFTGLPDAVKADWLSELHAFWSQAQGSTLLLARLEELY